MAADSPDQGKVFIGGISWKTTEEGLKEHFKTFGNVQEVMIVKDRNSGRPRGFGFVVFSDVAAADRVVKMKHTINGKLVEAKKAIPREGQVASGDLTQTRGNKIFVGGLASSVTEKDFKEYFEQFGKILDVVVMYDQTTHRPRGFGFVTYDSQESVDNVLKNTFHEFKGKTVEVKKAIPKEAFEAKKALLKEASSTPLPISLAEFNNARGVENYCYGLDPLPCLERIGDSQEALNFSSRATANMAALPSLGSLDLGTRWAEPICRCRSSDFEGHPCSYPMSNPISGPTRSMWSNGGIGCTGVNGPPGFGPPTISCSKVHTWHSPPAPVSNLASENSINHWGKKYGFGVPEDTHHRPGNGGFGLGLSLTSSLPSSVPGYVRNCDEGNNGSFDFRDLKVGAAPSELPPVTSSFGLDGLVSGIPTYSGPHESTGRPTNTGVAA